MNTNLIHKHIFSVKYLFIITLSLVSSNGSAKNLSEKCEMTSGAMIKEMNLSPACGGKTVRIGFEKKAGQDAYVVEICVPKLVAGLNSKVVYEGGQIQLLMLDASDKDKRSVIVTQNSTRAAKVGYPEDHSQIVLRTLGQQETLIADRVDSSVCNINIAYLGEKNRKVKITSEGSKNKYEFKSSEIPAPGTAEGVPATIPPQAPQVK